MTGGDHDRAPSCFVAVLGGVLICWRDPAERGQVKSRKVRAVGWGQKPSNINTATHLARRGPTLRIRPHARDCSAFRTLCSRK